MISARAVTRNSEQRDGAEHRPTLPWARPVDDLPGRKPVRLNPADAAVKRARGAAVGVKRP
jgi:hypothetical protein